MTGNTTGYEQVQREIQIMKKTNHPHILKLFEVLETPKKVHLVLGLYLSPPANLSCAGGELLKQIKKEPCTESDYRIIVSRLADAVCILPYLLTLKLSIPP
jgi:serine/threonine protein kinase